MSPTRVNQNGFNYDPTGRDKLQCGVQFINTGSVAVDPAKGMILLNPTAASQILTLADGEEGTIIELSVIAIGTPGVDFMQLTPTNFNQGTSITFNALYDYAKLLFKDGEWVLVTNIALTIT